MNSKNLTHSTPLHMAVETGQENVVEYLLSRGVHLNDRNLYGQTPKAVATVLGRSNILEMLQEAESS